MNAPRLSLFLLIFHSCVLLSIRALELKCQSWNDSGIWEFGTLRSECVLNASEGVSTRNGELESQVEFHNSRNDVGSGDKLAVTRTFLGVAS